MLASAVVSAGSLPDGSGQILVELSVPHASAGAIIGRGGSYIADVQTRTGIIMKVLNLV